MTRTTSLTLAAALVVTACARQANESSTTTLTSGAAGGPRVTNTRPGDDQTAMRLADELCRREAVCNRIGGGNDAHYRSEEACMADHGSRAPAQVSRWACSPPATSAGFEECLAAVRSEDCDTRLDRADRLAACRTAAVCGR